MRAPLKGLSKIDFGRTVKDNECYGGKNLINTRKGGGEQLFILPPKSSLARARLFLDRSFNDKKNPFRASFRHLAHLHITKARLPPPQGGRKRIGPEIIMINSSGRGGFGLNRPGDSSPCWPE